MLTKLSRIFGSNGLEADEFTACFESVVEELANEATNYYDRLPIKDSESYQQLKSLPFVDKIRMLRSLFRAVTYYAVSYTHLTLPTKA